MKHVLSIFVLFALVGGMAITAQAQEGTISLLEAEEGPECRFDGDPIIPMVQSLLIPGLGQVANGQNLKALFHFGVAIGAPILSLTTAAVLLVGNPIGFFLVRVGLPVAQLSWHMYSAFDAYSVSSTYCQPDS